MTSRTISKLCAVEGCGAPHSAKGFCTKHYQRYRVHGSPLHVNSRFGTGETQEARFWSRVDKNGPIHPYNPSLGRCWEWVGCRLGERDYGSVGYRGKNIATHRMAWIYVYGSRPALHILHSCDNRPCCNPKHLREGTAKDNHQDMIRRGRKYLTQGEKSGTAKLNAEQVYSILSDNRAQSEIARDYGVDQSTISNIKTRRRWTHL